MAPPEEAPLDEEVEEEEVEEPVVLPGRFTPGPVGVVGAVGAVAPLGAPPGEAPLPPAVCAAAVSNKPAMDPAITAAVAMATTSMSLRGIAGFLRVGGNAKGWSATPVHHAVPTCRMALQDVVGKKAQVRSRMSRTGTGPGAATIAGSPSRPRM